MSLAGIVLLAGATIARRTHISRFGGASMRCSDFGVEPCCKSSCRFTLRSTITLIWNATSFAARITSKGTRR